MTKAKKEKQRAALQEKLDNELIPQLEQAKEQFGESNPIQYERANDAVKDAKEKIAALDKEILGYEKEINDYENKKTETNNQIAQQKEQLANYEKDKVRQAYEESQKPKPEEEDNSKLPFYLKPDFSRNLMSLTQGISQLTAGFSALSSV